jgi:hypothetical protein
MATQAGGEDIVRAEQVIIKGYKGSVHQPRYIAEYPVLARASVGAAADDVWPLADAAGVGDVEMVEGGAYEGGAVEGEHFGVKKGSLREGIGVRAAEGGFYFYAHGVSLWGGEEREKGFGLRCKVLELSREALLVVRVVNGCGVTMSNRVS